TAYWSNAVTNTVAGTVVPDSSRRTPNPSRSGIWTSRNSNCGESASVCATASRPPAHAATTSASPVSSISRTSRRRAIFSSSATMTVSISGNERDVEGVGAALAQRRHGGVQRALALGRDAAVVAALEGEAKIVGEARELALGERGISVHRSGDAVE